MKILHIITGLSTGGAEMMLLKLLERMRPNFQNQVLSLTTVGGVGEAIKALGIPVECLGLRPGCRTMMMGMMQLRKHIRQVQPDIVQTWMYHADLFGGLVARTVGLRAIAWNIRNSDLSPDTTRASTRAVVWGCALLSRSIPSRIVCCSNVARRIHEKLGYARSKFVYIPNGFDLSRFRPDSVARIAVREELGIAIDAPLVGLIARYDPQKNHLGFLEAAVRLHRTRPDIHFVLAGNGVDAANGELVKAVEQAGIAHAIHLLGQKADMPRLIAALDVLALSSSYGEAFPNVLGEAMACGVPCAVTDVGDSAAIVYDTGRVVAPGDMVGLAGEIGALLSLSPEDYRALSLKARARMEKFFDIGLIVRRYEACYEEMYNKATVALP